MPIGSVTVTFTPGTGGLFYAIVKATGIAPPFGTNAPAHPWSLPATLLNGTGGNVVGNVNIPLDRDGATADYIKLMPQQIPAGTYAAKVSVNWSMLTATEGPEHSPPVHT